MTGGVAGDGEGMDSVGMNRAPYSRAQQARNRHEILLARVRYFVISARTPQSCPVTISSAANSPPNPVTG